jgi:thiamine biosynthesis lipoprotein
MRPARIRSCRTTLAAWTILMVCAASVLSCSSTRHAAETPVADRAARHEFTGTAMGCVVSITIDDDDASRARSAARAGLLELDRLDAMYSDWKRSSELSRANDARGGSVVVSAEFAALLRRALEVARATDGRFDPAVGTLVALWRESRKSGALPTPEQLAAARHASGWREVAVSATDSEGSTAVLRRPDGLRLDFGGIAKGEGAVRALAAIARAGCPRAIVAVAGDIACGDAPRAEAGWRVELEGESPTGPRRTVLLAQRAISTSGGAQQFVEIGGTRYAHIVDARTGLGATRLAQATVLGALDPAVDALGTALALTETDDEARAILRQYPGYRAVIERDGSVRELP